MAGGSCRESTFPIRQLGTPGNVFFQSGGQFATQLAAIVVYAKAD